MVWALLVILFGVGLFLGYAIEHSTIRHKVVWRNILTASSFFLLVCPLIAAVFLLPPPWQEQVSSVVLICCSAIFWFRIITEPIRRKRVGSLLWSLGRPAIQKIMLIGGILFFVGAGLQTSLFIHLASKGFSGSDSNPDYFLLQVIFNWSIAFYFVWVGSSRLELREHGIYYKFGSVEWPQIASYRWEGLKHSTLTVWLKQRFPFFPTRSWQIPVVYQSTVERFIEQNLGKRV
ncbi:MAG TPA: hypothetical protein DDZ80_04760 [Cyanobacteria bacterium UBA8803]|nr:hypothetical protein [Cyanobacteria bacterium UBA9273]HBL57870.1 hypothetical protein [Cyanobacteria bacterium UBA8803]